MKKILLIMLLSTLSCSVFAKSKVFDITFFEMFNNSRSYKVDLFANGPIRCTPAGGAISPTATFHTQCVDNIPDDIDYLLVSLDSQPVLDILLKDLSGTKRNYCYLFSSNGTPQVRCTTEDEIKKAL